MPSAFCKGWGEEIEIPDGIRSGEVFDCPNWAGISLRVSEKDGVWSMTEIKKASCAAGNEMLILPDDAEPGDIIECHGAKQRVTYEFGAYALEKVKVPLGGGWERIFRPRFECQASREKQCEQLILSPVWSVWVAP